MCLPRGVMNTLMSGLVASTFAFVSACQLADEALRPEPESEPEAAAVVEEAPVEPAAPPLALPPQEGRKPYVIIRFSEPDVAFEDPLARAVGAALERKAEVAFDLLALTPASEGTDGSAILPNIERVFRVIIAMGVPAGRIALWSITSSEITAPEIRLFVR